MDYTRFFRNLREAKGLTIEELARRARRHRNTVVNVESGRPVKFRTIAELMLKMGYGPNSPETKGIALLWLESVSGIPFSQPETEAAARKAVSGYRAAARQAARRLDEAMVQAGLDAAQIELLTAAVRQPAFLSVLDSLRQLAEDLASGSRTADLKVAEDKRQG